MALLFYIYFYDLNLGPQVQDHLGPSDLHFIKLEKRTTKQCYIPNFQHLSQVILKKIFELFSMYFYGLTLGPLPRGHLQTWDLHLNKLGNGPLGNADTN